MIVIDNSRVKQCPELASGVEGPGGSSVAEDHHECLQS